MRLPAAAVISMPKSEISNEMQRLRFAAAIIKRSSIGARANANNVPRRATNRRAAHLRGRARFSRRHERSLDQVVGQMCGSVVWAGAEIVRMSATASSESVRLKALALILSYCRESVELADLEARISQLEQALATKQSPKPRNEPVAASIDRDDLASEADNHAEPATRSSPRPRNEPVAASNDCDGLPSETDNHREPVTQATPRPRNEPVADSTDCDGLPSETDKHGEPATQTSPSLQNEPVAASIDRDDLPIETVNHEPGASKAPRLRNEPVAASIDRDDLPIETVNDDEPGASKAPRLRNEPVAASIDRDDLPNETVNDDEPGASKAPSLRNEPVAASIDPDDLASETVNDAEPGDSKATRLRNEPVAASIDRDGLARRAVWSVPAFVSWKPPDRPRSRGPRRGPRVANDRRMTSAFEGSSQSAPAVGRPSFATQRARNRP